MKLEFHERGPWPRWTVHAVHQMSISVVFEYCGKNEDLVLQQHLYGNEVSVTRELRWSDERDRDLLRSEAKALFGEKLETVRDLENLATLYYDDYFALHATDRDGKSLVVVLPGMGDLDPCEDPDSGFAMTYSAEDEEADAAVNQAQAALGSAQR